MSTLSDERIDETSPRLSIVKRVAIFVLAPSLIAGGFAIAPKVYEEITRPTSTLSYFVASGPALSTDGVYRQIFSINIENAGKLPLTNVVAEVRLDNGKIESFVADKSSIHPNVSGSGPEYQLMAQRMLPGERVIASVMTDSPVADPSLQINIRSD